MRTIRVTGKGKVNIHPDMTRITIEIEGVYREYNDALRFSSERTEQLKEILSPFGFERSDLKTLGFNINTEYESYKERDLYKRRFIGYKFTHIMKVEFESDNQRLGKILYALATCNLHPEFRLSYTVRDPEPIKNELLGKAVMDATSKAKVLAAAAGVSLKAIQNIDYSWGEVNFEVQPMGRDLLMAPACEESCADSYDLNIEPDDIDFSDTVTVIWEIE